MARRRSIQAVIDRVFDEEMHYYTEDGRLETCDMEEGIVRASVKRALDPRSKLGQEAARFLIEYRYGKAVQPVVAVRDIEDEFDDLSEEELLMKQATLLKGALSGHTGDSQKDPSRFLEERERGEVLQVVLDSGRENGVIKANRERAKEASERRRAEEEVELTEADELFIAGRPGGDLGAKSNKRGSETGNRKNDKDFLTRKYHETIADDNPEGTDDLLVGPWG